MINFKLGIIRAEVDDIKPTSVVVMWELLSNEIIPAYTIFYRNTNNTQCFNDSDIIHGVTTMQHTLRNLQEATEYSINVTAILSDGEAGDNVTVSTLATGQKLRLC